MQRNWSGFCNNRQNWATQCCRLHYQVALRKCVDFASSRWDSDTFGRCRQGLNFSPGLYQSERDQVHCAEARTDPLSASSWRLITGVYLRKSIGRDRCSIRRFVRKATPSASFPEGRWRSVKHGTCCRIAKKKNCHKIRNDTEMILWELKNAGQSGLLAKSVLIQQRRGLQEVF